MTRWAINLQWILSLCVLEPVPAEFVASHFRSLPLRVCETLLYVSVLLVSPAISSSSINHLYIQDTTTNQTQEINISPNSSVSIYKYLLWSWWTITFKTRARWRVFSMKNKTKKLQVDMLTLFYKLSHELARFCVKESDIPKKGKSIIILN